ncbi:hypothetical protein [Streptomyces sp. NPDC015125]|uniref:hypothetical protein n=1 Tax=Streptomyces sp. NPDC015125 TaxID=3364938 RepID=UPI00370350F6
MPEQVDVPALCGQCAEEVPLGDDWQPALIEHAYDPTAEVLISAGASVHDAHRAHTHPALRGGPF